MVVVVTATAALHTAFKRISHRDHSVEMAELSSGVVAVFGVCVCAPFYLHFFRKKNFISVCRVCAAAWLRTQVWTRSAANRCHLLLEMLTWHFFSFSVSVHIGLFFIIWQWDAAPASLMCCWCCLERMSVLLSICVTTTTGHGSIVSHSPTDHSSSNFGAKRVMEWCGDGLFPFSLSLSSPLTSTSTRRNPCLIIVQTN